MKRKTNLFYLTGPDSKFITFSNYTESLTGNFLSTDTKLFPSRFLCLNIQGLTETNKPALIKYLAQYYESKMAVLRDTMINDDKTIEHNILPLNYLLEALYKITAIGENYIEYSAVPQEDSEIVTIPYISDITEQDYNGTFTDTICVVNLNDAYSATLSFTTDLSTINDDAVSIDVPVYTDADTECLYGWENKPTENYYTAASIFDMYDGSTEDTSGAVRYVSDSSSDSSQSTYRLIDYSSEYYSSDETSSSDNSSSSSSSDDSSMYDELSHEYGQYNVNSYIERLILTKNTENTLSFNVVIPLFDVVDINYKSNFTTIAEDYDTNIDDTGYRYIDLVDSQTNDLYTKNVPLGMWFYSQTEDTANVGCETDNQITLYKDADTGYSQSWSLVISSQFKPFPYSKSMPNEVYTNSNSNAFATFAQVLSKQNYLMDKLTDVQYQFTYMNTRLNNLTAQINQLGTSYNIDGVHAELINWEQTMSNEYSDFKEQILAYISNLKWNATL